MMRRSLSILASLTLGTGLGGAVLAQSAEEDRVIESTEPGALPPPAAWRCEVIEPEYSAWLASGQEAEDFRLAGKTWHDAETGSVYDWQDWLAWRSRTECTKGAAIPTDRIAIGAALSALGAGVLLASNGANAKSPG